MGNLATRIDAYRIDSYIEAVLREYDSLRAESEGARDAQRTFLSWGSAGAGAIAAIAATTVRDLAPASILLLLFVLPAFLTLAMMLWIGEMVRMRRAGEYIQAIELKLAAALRGVSSELESKRIVQLPARTSFSPLEWEQWLAGSGRHRAAEGQQTRHMTWLYTSILSAARATAVCSPFFATAVTFGVSFPGEDTVWRYAILIVALSVCGTVLWAWGRLSRITRVYMGELWPSPADLCALKELIPPLKRRSLMRSIKALMIDLDGTLIDSVPLHAKAYARAASYHDMVLTDEELEAQRGRSPKEFFEVILRARGRPADDAEALARKKEEEAERLVADSPPKAFEGASDLIDGALQRGLKVAIVSSGSRDAVKRRLLSSGLFDDRLVLVCGDDVPRGKPDPDPYAEAIRQLGVSPEECLAIEDATSGVESARASGARSVWLIGSQGADQTQADEVIADLRAARRLLGW